jgi:hypothetical protein
MTGDKRMNKNISSYPRVFLETGRLSVFEKERNFI